MSKRDPLLKGTMAVLFLLSRTVAFGAMDVPARTVEIVADKDNRFRLADGSLGPLTLKAGEVVKFRVTSRFGGDKARDGAVHSFVVRKLRDKGWSVRLMEGVQEFTLTAPGPGNYLIECTVDCGPGHDDMHMKMVVMK
jgi:heme/copper-type cytochrome/quinol oxidase subunit 2